MLSIEIDCDRKMEAERLNRFAAIESAHSGKIVEVQEFRKKYEKQIK